MRPVYIETLYSGWNYGSRLQALGLARYIEGCGYDVHMMNTFKVPGSFIRHPTLLAARAYNRLHRKKRFEFFVPSPYEIDSKRQSRLDDFLEENYNEANFTDSKSWKATLAENPIFVVGSDILWQPSRGYPARHFLDYAVVEGAPCFSYASSIGANALPKSYYHAYRKYLGEFQSIGVREEASVALLEPIVGKPVTKVVDPTLLYAGEDWDYLAEQAELSKPIEEEGFVLCYFVMDDPRYWEYVASVREATGLQMVVLPMHYNDENQPYTIIEDGTPYEFVWLIKNAKFVLTDSFHACCFSMLYKKDFYLLRRTRADEDVKYNDFLGRYGLKDRVVENPRAFERKLETDYKASLAKLELDRIDSRAFIEGNLECLAH